MRPIICGLALCGALVCSIVYAQRQPPITHEPVSPPKVIGKGCTTAFVIDNDCDGYGIGPGMLRDADDNDDAVNTPTSVIEKYGTIGAFLGHLGYSHTHIYYLAPDGSDTAGVVNDPAHPYATVKGVMPRLGAGDAILMRDGTYHEAIVLSKSGTASAWCTIMAYPGELALLDTYDKNRARILDWTNQNYWHIHGLSLTDSQAGILPGSPYGIFGGYHGNITIRDNEISRAGTGIMAQYNIGGLLIEHNLVYDTKVEHDIYLGNSNLWPPADGIIVRGNVLGKSMYTNLHMNGQMPNPVVENNIMHSAQGGMTIQNGSSNGTFQNNVIFNVSQQSITMGCYYGSTAITPHPQNGNKFLNNTIWQGTASYVNGAAISGQDGFRIYDGSTPMQGYPCDMTGTVIVNNIIQTADGPSILFLNQNIGWLSTAIVKNNVFYQANKFGERTVKWGAGPSYAPKEDLSDGNTYYTLADLQTLYPGNISGNILARPLFTHANAEDWRFVGEFDFSLKPGSPAIHDAAPAQTPPTDIRGVPRGGLPDAGAYEDVPGFRLPRRDN
jgi:hypothetical protein